MKIVLAGGGSGGHVYPLIAVAEELRKKEAELKRKDANFFLDLTYLAPTPYDTKALEQHGVKFIKIPAGKMRRYFSFKNFTDIPLTIFGIVRAFWKLFWLYPDAVFAKGGFASAPVLLAARILFIPIMIHESDSIPGRANRWAGKFAKRVGISFEEAAEYFDAEKIRRTGNPVRSEIREVKGADPSSSPHTLLILGGSQGAGAINDIILESLPEILPLTNVIHQTGPLHEDTAKKVSAHIIEANNLDGSRYRVQGFFNKEELMEAVSQSTFIISRSGSGIFEIACWELPAILIPLSTSAGDHQRENAYAFNRRGAALVIEETNMTPSILVENIRRLIEDEALYRELKKNISSLCSKNAAEDIADELIELSVNHG